MEVRTEAKKSFVWVSSPVLDKLAAHDPVLEDDGSLIRRFRKGDKDAGYLLFVKHHRMVLKVILDKTKGKWFSDDVLHAGAIGLYEAARRFDLTLGYTFLTYAVHWINKYVLLEICHDALPAAGVMFGESFKDRLYRYIGYELSGLTEEEILKKMRISESLLQDLCKAAYAVSLPSSLDEKIANSLSGVQSAEDEYIDNCEYKEQIEQLVAAMPLNEQFILNHTLALSGHNYLTKERIREILELSPKEYSKYRRDAYKHLKVEAAKLMNREKQS